MSGYAETVGSLREQFIDPFRPKPPVERVFDNGSISVISHYLLGKLTVVSYILETNDNNIVLIDSGVDSEGVGIKAIIGDKTIKAVANTHSDKDHINGHAILTPGAAVYAHQNELEVISGNRRSDGLLQAAYNFFTKSTNTVDGLNLVPTYDGMEDRVDDIDLRFFNAEGHTTGSQVILAKKAQDEKYHLYTGDAAILYRDGVFRAAPWFLDHKHKVAQTNMSEVIRKILRSGHRIADGLAVHTGHSASGTFEQLANSYGVSLDKELH